MCVMICLMGFEEQTQSNSPNSAMMKMKNVAEKGVQPAVGDRPNGISRGEEERVSATAAIATTTGSVLPAADEYGR